MGLIPTASNPTFTGGTQTYNLSRLTQPLAGLPIAIDVPLPGGAKYVISARTQIGYDSYPIFPGFFARLARIIHEIRSSESHLCYKHVD